MVLIQDGVQVFCSIGYCGADNEKRNPNDIEVCPLGCETCDGDCFYYNEDWDKTTITSAVIGGVERIKFHMTNV